MRFTFAMLALLVTSLPLKAADKQFAGSNLEDIMRESGELPPLASEPIPKEFLDQKIIVIGKDGKPMSEFERSKWKIVPRDDKPKKAVVRDKPKEEPKCEVCAPPAPPPMPKIVEKIVTVEKRVFHHHNVTAYGGLGYDGLETTYDSDRDVIIDNKKSLLLGLSYSYSFNYDWNATALYISNQSALIGGGYSW